MIALLIFMVIDFLSGLILAIIFKKSKKTESGRLSSQAGILGLTKKIFILFLVAVSTQLDIILGTNFIRDGTVIGFISMEGISIIENASLAGLPIPRVIKNALEIISKKEKDKDKDE
jgi:toxin secretion/phage lysis holin